MSLLERIAHSSRMLAMASGSAILNFAVVCVVLAGSLPVLAVDRPNILWIVAEDHGPHMGCNGDEFATTPNVDELASRGMCFDFAWSNAPVCASARTTLWAGIYSTSTGGEHMRSMVPFPAGKKMFPELLREAGYYCAGNGKEDYNVPKSDAMWDESPHRAHWNKCPKGKPFFAYFNNTESHEGKIHNRKGEAQHDPKEVRVPAYHPDHPVIREEWARYYDSVTAVDAAAGTRIKEIEDSGLADETIIFYFADHGAGLAPYDFGHDESLYPVERVLHTAELASMMSADAVPELGARLSDGNAIVRYWAALGFVMRSESAVAQSQTELMTVLADSSTDVRMAAARRRERGAIRVIFWQAHEEY